MHKHALLHAILAGHTCTQKSQKDKGVSCFHGGEVLFVLLEKLNVFFCVSVCVAAHVCVKDSSGKNCPALLSLLVATDIPPTQSPSLLLSHTHSP